VVGADIGTLATAAFLEQNGLDPVLATAGPGRARSPAVTLWRPGLELLERIGLRRPVEQLGTQLETRHRPTASNTVGEAGISTTLVAIGRETLAQLLGDRLDERVRTTDRSVTNVASSDMAVRVTFERDVEERFDIVVTSSPDLLARGQPGESAHRIHSWSFPWPVETPAPEGLTEAWDADCAAFSVPVGDTRVARIVATGGADPETPIASADLDARFGHLFEPPADPLADLDQWDLQYRQTPCAMPASIRAGRVTLVGRPVSGSVPGDCLGAALGIEDAWVLADSLAYGPDAIDDALAEYASRRRRRNTEILDRYETRSGPPQLCEELTPVLWQLWATRAIAFGHRSEPSGPTLADDIPYRL